MTRLKLIQNNSLISSDFRGYTIRKRFGPELEEKFKTILNNYNDKFEAHNALLREGLKNEEAAFIVQRWYKKEEKVKKKKSSVNDPIHYKLRQADLIQFSQNVSLKVYFKIVSKVLIYLTFSFRTDSLKIKTRFILSYRTSSKRNDVKSIQFTLFKSFPNIPSIFFFFNFVTKSKSGKEKFPRVRY